MVAGYADGGCLLVVGLQNVTRHVFGAPTFQQRSLCDSISCHYRRYMEEHVVTLAESSA